MGGADGSITISTDLDTASVENSMNGLGSTIVKWAAAAVAAWGLFKAAIFATGSAIDVPMNTIAARTGMANDAVDELRQGFRDLSRDVGEGAFNMQEISEAFASVALHGHDGAHALDIMSASMILAQATGESLGDAAYFLGNYLLKVGKDSTNAERYINMFAHTVRDTNIPLSDLQNYMFRANAMIQAGSVASYQAAAAFGVMYTEGLRGSQMYSGMNTVIRDLINPSQRLTEIMDELGVAQFDIVDSSRNAMDVMLELGDAVNQANDPLLRNALLLELGTDMGTQFMDAMFENVDVVRGLSSELFRSQNSLLGVGVGFEMAAANGRTLINAFSRIRGATMAILDAFWMAKREVNIDFFYQISDAIWAVADSDALARFIETFGRVTGVVFGGIYTLIMSVARAFQYLVTSINFSSLARQFEPILSVLRRLIAAVTDLIGAFARLAGAFLSFVSSGDNGFISGLIDSLVTLATFVIEMVINKIRTLTFVLDILRASFFTAGEGTGQLGEMLQALFGVFQALFRVVLDVVMVIGTELHTVFNSFATQMMSTESSGSSFASFLTHLTQAFTSLARLITVVGGVLVDALVPAIRTVFTILGMLVQIVGSIIGGFSSFIDIVSVVATVLGSVLNFALERVAAIIRALAGSLDRLLMYFGIFLAVVTTVAGIVATVLTAAFVALTYVLEGLAHVIELVVIALGVMLYKKIRLKVVQTLTSLLAAYNAKTIAMAKSKQALNIQLAKFAGYTRAQQAAITQSNTKLTLYGATLTKVKGTQAANILGIRAQMSAQNAAIATQKALTAAIEKENLARARLEALQASGTATTAKLASAKAALTKTEMSTVAARGAHVKATEALNASQTRLLAKQKVQQAKNITLNKSLVAKKVTIAQTATATAGLGVATATTTGKMYGLKAAFLKFAGPVSIIAAGFTAFKIIMSDELHPAIQAILVALLAFTATFAIMTKLKSKTLAVNKAFVGLKVTKKGLGLGALISQAGGLGGAFVLLGKKVVALTLKLKAKALVMLANPIGLAVAAVAGLAAGVVVLIRHLRRSSEANTEWKNTLAEAREEADRVSQAVQDSAEAFGEQRKAMADSHSETNNLISSVQNLANSQTRTTAQTQIMNQQIADLNRRMPGLNLAFDETTGALNMSTEAMNLFVAQAQGMEVVERYTNRLNEVAREGYELRQQEAAALGYWQELWAKYTGEIEDHGMSQNELAARLAEVQGIHEDLSYALANNIENYEYLTQSLYTHAEALGVTTEELEAYLEARNREREAIETLEAIYEGYMREAQKAFAEVAESGEISTSAIIGQFNSLTERMEAQAQAWRDYAENMRTIEEVADDLNIEAPVMEELMRMVNGCKDTINYLANTTPENFQAVVDAVADSMEAAVYAGLAEFEALGGDASALLDDAGAYISRNTSIEDGMVTGVNAATLAVYRALQDGDFAGMARGALGDFQHASDAELGNIAQSGYNVGEAYQDGYKSSMEQNSPSQVMLRFGKGANEGFIQGVVSKLRAVTSSGSDVGKAFLEPIRAINLHPIGAAAIDGLIAGMDSRVGALNARAQQIAASVTRTLQNALQVRSPSRVMRDEVGVHITDGIAVGMEDGLPNALSVCEKIANLVVKKFTTTIALGRGMGLGILDEINYVRDCAVALVKECVDILYSIPKKVEGLSVGIADQINKGIPAIKDAIQAVKVVMDDLEFASLAELERHIDELPDILVKFDTLTIQLEDKLGILNVPRHVTQTSGGGDQHIDLDVNIYYDRDEDPDIYDHDVGRRIGQDFQRELRSKGFTILPT